MFRDKSRRVNILAHRPFFNSFTYNNYDNYNNSTLENEGYGLPKLILK